MTDRLFELGEAECFRLLARGRFGRVGLVEGERAVVLPVNYVFHEGCVVFQSTAGSKLDAARGRPDGRVRDRRRRPDVPRRVQRARLRPRPKWSMPTTRSTGWPSSR